MLWVWLLPIGRLHRLAGRELATGCRSSKGSLRDLDSSLPELRSCCTIWIRNPEEIAWSDGIPDHAVGCTSPFVKTTAQELLHPCTSKHVTLNLKGCKTVKGIGHLQPRKTVAQELLHPCTSKHVTLNLKGCKTVKGIGHLQSRKTVAQNLPFMARRSFSCDSRSVHTDTSSRFGSGDSKLFLQNLDSANEKRKKKLDKESLEAEFRNQFKPLFALNGVMLPSTLEDDTTAYLNGQVHGFTKEWPVYLSSLDFMERIKRSNEDQVNHLIDYIIQRRILVSDDFENSYGNIELLRYNVSSDPSCIRGECDAAFEAVNKESGIARVAMLIWEGNKLVYADVIEGLECPDSVGAEILAGLALVLKCKEMGYKKMELWSDSSRVCGVISGSESLYRDDKNLDNCLVLRCLQSEFTELIPVCKPRDFMFVTDEMLKLEGSVESRVAKALEKWSLRLKGQILFSVTNTKRTTTAIKAFAGTRMKKKQGGYVYKHDRVFYWKAEGGDKFAAFLKLRDAFSPNVLYLTVDRFEEKPAILCEMLKDLYPLDIVTSGSGTTTTFRYRTSSVNSIKKPLVIVWDACLYKECYDEGSCVIILVEDEKEVSLMKSAKIKEINVSTFLYFNGVEFKESENKVTSSNGQKKEVMSSNGQKNRRKHKPNWR